MQCKAGGGYAGDVGDDSSAGGVVVAGGDYAGTHIWEGGGKGDEVSAGVPVGYAGGLEGHLHQKLAEVYVGHG